MSIFNFVWKGKRNKTLPKHMCSKIKKDCTAMIVLLKQLFPKFWVLDHNVTNPALFSITNLCAVYNGVSFTRVLQLHWSSISFLYGTKKGKFTLQSTLIWYLFNTYCIHSGSCHRFKIVIKVCQMEMSVMKWEHAKILPEIHSP